MFQQLRQGNPFFIIDLTDGVKAEVGVVADVTGPTPKYPNNYSPYMPPPPGTEMVMNVKVSIGDRTMELDKLPAAATIADFTAQGRPLIVTTSREAVNEQLRSLRAKSQQIIESVPYNEKVIKDCDAAYILVNPEVAQRDEEQRRIESLDNQVKDMAKNFGAMQNDMQDLKKMIAAALSGAAGSGGNGSSAKTPKN